jgi:hypothetical protein
MVQELRATEELNSPDSLKVFLFFPKPFYCLGSESGYENQKKQKEACSTGLNLERLTKKLCIFQDTC